ncbi:MAG: NIPSNAP family protein [Acidobacteriota bacterium]
MTRRNLIATPAAALAASSAAPAKKSLFQLRLLKLRNGPENQRQRAAEFLKAVVPAAKRAGVGPIGVFSSSIAEGGPFLLVLTSHPGFAELEANHAKLEADAEYRKAVDAWYAGGLPYVRQEVSLLRAFDSMPAIEAPPAEGRKSPRIFELRTYESNTLATLRRKMKMFDDGEVAIFRRAGLLPVFFGETLIGRNMPNLVYMVAHDDLAAREQNWRRFGADPDWQKLRSQPGLGDAEIVSNISNALLSPLPFSDIR